MPSRSPRSSSKPSVAKTAAGKAPRVPALASAPLTRRDLNRAMLARQLLLQREKVSVAAALEQVAGLQAQLPGPPYVGLWTRLAAFARPALAEPLLDHALVRAPFFRGTLHLVTAADYARFRPVVAPMLHRSFASMAAERLKGIDPFALAAEARPFLREAPRTQDEVRDFLGAKHPKLDIRMVGHAVRLHLPLVQVPERGAGSWDFPSMPRFALAEEWISRPFAKAEDPADLVRRYLAAFGPATARDFQTWSGIAAADTFERLRPELRVDRDEKGRELFDLPEAPRPGGDAPAPVRFLPEYDNTLLAHVDRSRIVPEEFRPKVFVSGLRVAPTFLVDGFVRGAWDFEPGKKAGTLALTAFAPLDKKERAAVEAEAAELARFLSPEGVKVAIQFRK